MDTFINPEKEKVIMLLKDNRRVSNYGEYDRIVHNLKSVISTYGNSELLEEYIGYEGLYDFARNYKLCKVKGDALNFSISYKRDNRKVFLRVNRLSGMIFGTEELSEVDDSCSFLAKEGDPVILKRDVVFTTDSLVPICKEYKVGPLFHLDEVGASIVKKSCMKIEGISEYNSPSDWSLGEKQKYLYDFSSSKLKKNYKEMRKN